MAIEKVVNITVKDNASVADKHVKELDRSLNKLEGSTSGVTGAMKESSLSVLENGGAMGLLNDATGGMAMTVKDAVESFALFSKGSKIATAATALQTWVTNGATVATKALRATLISTGIGAVVVLITALVVAMSNMESSAKKAENAQKLLNDEIERSNQLLSQELSDIDYVTKAQILRAEKQGKSVKEIQAIENGASADRLAALKVEQTKLLELQDRKDKTPEQAKAINDALVKNTSAFNKEIQNQELSRLTDEKDNAVKGRENQAKANEESKAKSKEHNDKLLADRKAYLDKANAFDEENNLKAVDTDKIKRDADKIAMQEDLINKVAIGDNWVSEQRRISEQEILDLEEANIRKIEIEQTLQDAKRNALNTGLDILQQFAGKNKKIALGILVIQKGLAIADIVVGAAKSISAATSALAAVPAVIGVVPNPMYAVQAASTIKGIALTKITAATSIASILAAGIGQAASISGGSGGSAGGSDGGRQSAPPQFNIVGQNSNNQLAQSIGKSQNRPVEAFVVSGNMTTAQSLDRNRIATATFNS
jgi:hypothetical protein